MTNDTICGIIATAKEVKTVAIDYSKLKIIRKNLKYTHEDMAELLGINKRVYRSYESGERDPSTEMLIKICKTFQLTADELLGMSHAAATVPIRNDIKIINGKVIYMIPIYYLSSNYDNEPIERMPEYFENLRAARATFAIKCEGDAMYPIIADGDTLIVHKQEHFRAGDIVIANNGQNIVRKVVKTRDKITLETINPIYPPITIKEKADEFTKIVGVVKKIVKTL